MFLSVLLRCEHLHCFPSTAEDVSHVTWVTHVSDPGGCVKPDVTLRIAVDIGLDVTRDMW